MTSNLEEQTEGQILSLQISKNKWSNFLVESLEGLNIKSEPKIPIKIASQILFQWISNYTKEQQLVHAPTFQHNQTQQSRPVQTKDTSTLEENQKTVTNQIQNQLKEQKSSYQQKEKETIAKILWQMQRSEYLQTGKLQDYEVIRTILNEYLKKPILTEPDHEIVLENQQKRQQLKHQQEANQAFQRQIQKSSQNIERTETPPKQNKKIEALLRSSQISISQGNIQQQGLSNRQSNQEHYLQQNQQKRGIFNNSPQSLFQSQAISLPLRKSRLEKSCLNPNVESNFYDNSASKNYLSMNPYLVKMYKHLCQQNIGRGRSPTFDQIAQAGNEMSLNKWMVFCKEFNFTEKLSKRQLMDVFKWATDNRSMMNYDQFLSAVSRLQSMLKLQTPALVRDILHVQNEVDYRNKVANLKVNYFGPKTDFFTEVRVKEITKKIQRFYIHKARKSQQHSKPDKNLHSQVVQQVKKSPNLRRKHYDKTDYRKMVLQNSTYSQIFKHKTQRSTSTESSNLYKLNKVLKDAKSETNHENNDSIGMSNSRVSAERQSPIRNRSLLVSSRIQEKRDTLPSINMQSIQQNSQKYLIDSDAQSDQILKEHYKNQKKGQNSMIYSRLAGKLQLKTQEKTFGEQVEENQSEDDATTNYLITQYRN